MQKLLAATETTGRLLQHGATLGGIFLLVIAMALFGQQRGFSMLGAVALALGLIAIFCGLRVKIRWEVPYKGHIIRFENDGMVGEKLFIDGQQVARGGLGFRMVLAGQIKDGEGTGDRIEAVSYAGLLEFRCEITAHPAAK